MENKDFSFTPKPPKPTRRVAPRITEVAVQAPVVSSGGGPMDYLPLLVALGTLGALYLLYKEFKRSEQKQYELGQMVKNMQAKFDETPFMTPDQVFPVETYSDSESEPSDDGDDDDDDDDDEESGDEEIVIKQS